MKSMVKTVRSVQQDLLTAYIEKNQIQIWHSHFAPHGWKYYNYTKKINLPHVISFYGFDYESLPFRKPEYLGYYRTLFKNAAAFICEGEHGANTLAKMGCPAEKLHIVRLGVTAIPEFQPIKKSSNELRLIQVANITEKKGHIYTLEAFAQAIKNCPNMQLTFVGKLKETKDTWIAERMKALISMYKMEDKIKFVNSVDFTMLSRFMSDYQVFIHPSCYAKDMDCEGGAPVSIIDAQALGMPVISTYHCDIPNVVDDKRSGLLCRENDVEALTQNIETFYRMEGNDFETYSNNARSIIESKFLIKSSGEQLLKIYKQILK
jgi:colanic acid/amylovoran biosynthesis glycosyltransferase